MATGNPVFESSYFAFEYWGKLLLPASDRDKNTKSARANFKRQV